VLPKISDELRKQTEEAVRVHGHLGPFLVVGVRMGRLANEKLKPSHSEHGNFKAHVKVPSRPPYSCMQDGIQSTTQCTVGNGKLSFEESEEIAAEFKPQDPNTTLRITVDSKFVKTLVQQIKTGVPLDLLAENAASMKEDELFKIKPK
jgi:formylmethanofuran dehydrogenase subunit E